MTRSPLPEAVFDGVIDLSHHNGAIDWPVVAGAGIALAFLKATQGTRFIDPTFERNRTGAVRAGVLVVPYHFIDGADPEAQAEHFIAVAGLAEGRPAMIDWETAVPIAAVTALGDALAECTGRGPVAYYGYSQLPMADPRLSAWPLMLPAYPRGNRCGDYQSLVTRGPRLPPGRAADWTAAGAPTILTSTPRPAASRASTVRSTARFGSAAEPSSSPGTLPAPCRADNSSPHHPNQAAVSGFFAARKGASMQILAYLLARFSEPSSYAGLGALLALVGWNLTDPVLAELAQLLAAGCGFVALCLKERGLLGAVVLAVAAVPVLGA